MSQQTPESASPANPVNPAAPVPPPTPGKEPPWGDDANFNAAEAWKTIQNLRREKGAPDPALRQQIEELTASQQAQRDAFAKALGLAPDEVSDTDKLAKTVTTLQGQILASERRALAAEHKIPAEFQHLLSATDSDGLKKQAEELVQFAQAAHYAATTAAPTPPPAFQANPGQGQGGGQLSPEAQEKAEYETYFPPTPQR